MNTNGKAKYSYSIPRVWRWVGGIVLMLLILLIAATVGIRAWKPSIKAKLTEAIQQSSDGLYGLTYDDMELHILTGTVRLKNAVLTSDSVRYQRVIESETAPDNRFDIKLEELEIRGVSIWSALIRKQLLVNDVLLRGGTLRIRSASLAHNKAAERQDATTLYDRVKAIFRKIKVDKISLEEFDIAYVKSEAGTTNELYVDRAQFRLYDILLDENSARDTTRLYYFKHMDMEIPSFAYDIPNSPYKITFDRFTLDSRENSSQLVNVALSPRIPKVDYFRNDKENKALIYLQFDSIRLEEMRFREVFQRQRIAAEYAYITGGSASFHKDKRFQKDNVNKVGDAPHQKIMAVNQLFDFDTVFVKNVDIAYHELSGRYLREGAITFQKAQGNLMNVTNDTVSLKKDGFMRADLKASLMGTGALHAVFSFDMLSDVGNHTYKGTLGPMQLPAFNRILTPLLNISFASGNIHRIRFDMLGNDYRNWGTFHFDYDQLKVELLHPPDKESNKRGKRGVLSFLVNQFLVNDSNPDANEVYHIGAVDYKRVPEYSHFKTLWKSLQEGIQQTVGLSESNKLKLQERE